MNNVLNNYGLYDWDKSPLDYSLISMDWNEQTKKKIRPPLHKGSAPQIKGKFVRLAAIIELSSSCRRKICLRLKTHVKRSQTTLTPMAKWHFYCSFICWPCKLLVIECYFTCKRGLKTKNNTPQSFRTALLLRRFNSGST